ncbi:putative uncharacterized protein DDB_G0287113 [Acropora millepora]|uniref:putative uncharacterized protein DDB_G0287113 n=1 Tax=Acropora millepora TaxID=45264 RepID=UPI001CF3C509|nr:putative uncharacterized protein DDB_G0287113 [Acropora millepora]
MEKQRKLELLSRDRKTENEKQQEQIGQLQRMNEELQDKVTNERDLKTPAEIVQQHTDERDSVERENQAWKKEIQEWKTKSEKYEQENQALQKSLERAMEQLSSDLETANNEPQEQIRQLQRMNEGLQDKVTNEREQRRGE